MLATTILICFALLQSSLAETLGKREEVKSQNDQHVGQRCHHGGCGGLLGGILGNSGNAQGCFAQSGLINAALLSNTNCINPSPVQPPLIPTPGGNPIPLPNGPNVGPPVMPGPIPNFPGGGIPPQFPGNTGGGIPPQFPGISGGGIPPQFPSGGGVPFPGGGVLPGGGVPFPGSQFPSAGGFPGAGMGFNPQCGGGIGCGMDGGSGLFPGGMNTFGGAGFSMSSQDQMSSSSSMTSFMKDAKKKSKDASKSS